MHNSEKKNWNKEYNKKEKKDENMKDVVVGVLTVGILTTVAGGLMSLSRGKTKVVLDAAQQITNMIKHR